MRVVFILEVFFFYFVPIFWVHILSFSYIAHFSHAHHTMFVATMWKVEMMLLSFFFFQFFFSYFFIVVVYFAVYVLLLCFVCFVSFAMSLCAIYKILLSVHTNNIAGEWKKRKAEKKVWKKAQMSTCTYTHSAIKRFFLSTTTSTTNDGGRLRRWLWWHFLLLILSSTGIILVCTAKNHAVYVLCSRNNVNVVIEMYTRNDIKKTFFPIFFLRKRRRKIGWNTQRQIFKMEWEMGFCENFLILSLSSIPSFQFYISFLAFYIIFFYSFVVCSRFSVLGFVVFCTIEKAERLAITTTNGDDIIKCQTSNTHRAFVARI